MLTTRFFEWFQFGILACLALLGVTRALWLRTRGVRVVVKDVDRQRTGWQMLADTLLFFCLLLWGYEIVAYGMHVRFHLWHSVLASVLVDNLILRLLGVTLGLAGLIIYGVSVRDLGASWRIGLDRAGPGPLITGGIYSRMRNPIYVAFDLLFAGTFLLLGRSVFLLTALLIVPLLHEVIRREEHFLTGLYGDAYRDYCHRVGRYFTW